MRAPRQTTLRRPASAAGEGLHTGLPATVVLKPASAGSGIAFRRKDAPAGLVPARADHVVAARLGVTLATDRVSVMTVEHLMAAFSLCGVDNALVEIDGPELPIFDGSAARYVELIGEAGVVALDAEREPIRIEAPVRVEDGERFIEATPARRFELDVEIDYADSAIGRRRARYAPDDDADMRARLALARTFCTLKDVDAMRAAGYARGGSLANAIVVDGERLLNEDGLRDPEEFVLHKMLDLIGDLALLGAPIEAKLRAFKPGHDLNVRFARAVLAVVAEPAQAEARRVSG